MFIDFMTPFACSHVIENMQHSPFFCKSPAYILDLKKVLMFEPPTFEGSKCTQCALPIVSDTLTGDFYHACPQENPQNPDFDSHFDLQDAQEDPLEYPEEFAMTSDEEDEYNDYIDYILDHDYDW